MKTSSAKAKGRRLQQRVRDDLRVLGEQFSLQDGDIESRGMGQSGVDIILSPAAQNLFNLDIEAKNVEKLNVPTVFLEHFEKYKDRPSLKLLVHARNRTGALVTLRWGDFLWLLSRVLPIHNGPENQHAEPKAPRAS